MIPVYDTVRSHKFPIVTVSLIAANVLVFLYEIQMIDSELQGLVFTWGLIPSHLWSDPTSTWVGIFTAMFLHGGWFHLISNMWIFLIFGRNVEARMGSIRFLIFYLLAGAAAGLLQSYVLPSSTLPMIGASGAIAGVLGAYLILFPGSRIASLVPIFFIFTLVEIPAFIFLLFWFVSQLYSGLFAIQGSAGSGIAWWAHIGGFVFGLVMVAFFTIHRKAVYRN